MKNISATILRTISDIEEKPKMFMVDPNYAALKNFLVGYFLGVENVTGIPINRNVSEWLSKKATNGHSLFWTEYVLHVLAEGDQTKAYKLLLDNIKEYLEENSSMLV